MLCSNVCSCGIVSSSLTISGSGGQGDPWVIETYGNQIVTSSTRPASPITGWSIYETDTKRELTFDGTNWVIMGGTYPGCSITHKTTDANQSVANGSVVDVVFPNEVYDTDGFHTGTTAVFTIPATLGGDFLLTSGLHYAVGATGYRYVLANIASNATVTTELPGIRSMNTGDGTGAVDLAPGVAKEFRLEAGATVTIQTYQTSGGALALTEGFATLRMVNHIPSLV